MGGDQLQGLLKVVLVPGPCDVPAAELWGGEGTEERRWRGDSGVKWASEADVLCPPASHLASLSLKSKGKGWPSGARGPGWSKDAPETREPWVQMVAAPWWLGAGWHCLFFNTKSRERHSYGSINPVLPKAPSSIYF